MRNNFKSMQTTFSKLAKFLSRKDNIIYLGFFIIILYYLPYLFLGKDSTLVIHDNLDGIVAQVKVLLDNPNTLLSPVYTVDQIMNGLPRSSVYGSYDISFFWFKLFGMFWGYVVNKFISSLVAFIGMYFLLKNHFLSNSRSSMLSFATALIFSLLPFWSFNLTVSAIPILMLAFLNIRLGHKNILNWVIILLFPFYSSLVLSGFFVMVIFLGIVIYDFIQSKKINFLAFLALVLLGVFYILSHLPLFLSFFFSDEGFLSHRTEILVAQSNFNGSLLESIKLFLFGQYHAESLHFLILIPVFIFGFTLIKNRKINLKFIYIFTFLVLSSLLYGFINWNVAAPLMNKIKDVLPLQFSRFHFLSPTFWYVLLAICLNGIIINLKNSKTIIGIFMLVQLIYVLSYHEIYKNSKLLTFKQFYAIEQFNNIKKYIEKPQKTYRVISIGLHPAVAQYNGFYTLDGYNSNYPLEYKHQFREVITRELEKDPSLKSYYDNWGSRIYAYSSELGKPTQKKSLGPAEIKDLEFNFKALKKMGGEFIFSAVKINNNKSIEFLKLFKNKDGGMDIYLYHVL